VPAVSQDIPVRESDAKTEKELPESTELHDTYHEAMRLYETGHFVKAAVSTRSMLVDNPNDARLRGLLARILANQGELAEAEEQSSKAIEADKLNAHHRYFHAVILHEQGRDDDAISALRKAMYVDPRFPLPHFLLGHLIARKGKSHDARKHFRHSLQLLAHYQRDQILPESEGMTAGRLREFISSILAQGTDV
jgi:chemotaxis protein methyltransferase CheR